MLSSSTNQQCKYVSIGMICSSRRSRRHRLSPPRREYFQFSQHHHEGGSRSTISSRSISISVSARLHFCREWVEQCVDNILTPAGENLLGKWDCYMRFSKTFLFWLDLFAKLTSYFYVYMFRILNNLLWDLLPTCYDQPNMSLCVLTLVD